MLEKARALQISSLFNLAKLRLDIALKQPRGKKIPAVIVDIDETLLDNYSTMLLVIFLARIAPIILKPGHSGSKKNVKGYSPCRRCGVSTICESAWRRYFLYFQP